MKRLIFAVLTCGILLPDPVLSQPVQWLASEGGNDHWYEVIITPDLVSWVAANQMANESELGGQLGYLATVTSEEENNWIAGNLIMGDVWIGAIQAPGSEEPLGGWEWVTGEPWAFEFWCSGEPANAGGVEDRIAITYSWPRCPGGWNDASQNNVCSGYLVEWDASVVPNETSSWGTMKATFRIWE